ncbi:unnamed protein product [Peronospora belbahrii]|uniref:Uncharacterized protein n=1 Tax=Peronospora belbahrii TaxID=622444 RepID=A0AAU9KT33_9STRA|nr:unnamed protein product [Peronospora belbahrii]CAH0520415.1 unnamed protein product [Peronospora belbahrii]
MRVAQHSQLHCEESPDSFDVLNIVRAFTLGRVDSKLYGSPSPVSALKELDPQNALDLGVFAFELSFEHQSARLNGQVLTVRQTHAGVLEIVVNEGRVWLPPIVAALLYKRTKELPDSVQVRFVRLEKVKFASLQLRGKGLAIMVLERSLKTRTTLTEGDVLFIRHRKEAVGSACIGTEDRASW